MMRKADLIQIPQIKSDDLERLWKRLPIYGYLQEKSVWEPKKEDPETYEKIVQANEEYLEGKVLDERRRRNGIGWLWPSWQPVEIPRR